MKHLRIARAVRATLALGGITVALGWATGPPSDSWRALMTAIQPSATSDFDQLLGSSAACVAWAGLLWVGGAVFLEVASVLPGAAGRGFAAVAAKTSPMMVHRIVQAAIGVSVLAGPLTAGSAFATGPSTTTSTSTQVDRPSSLTPALAETSHAPPTLDRPATAFVASPLPAPRRTPTGAVALVTGTPHRDGTDPRDQSANGYVVRRGDTLWDIAARHLGANATAVDISRAWPAWYDANRTAIGADPGVIRPGEVLMPPSTPTQPLPTPSTSTQSPSAPSTSTAPVGTR